MRTLTFALALGVLSTAPALADEQLAPGVYEVAYRLELPHVEGGPETTVRVCLTEVGGAAAFPVLSANNPLAGCPVKNLRREGREVSFEIVCPGGNSAKAQALYDLRDGGFNGRIAMNMGGKNMTMTEVQHGKRVGECDAVSGPAPASR